MEDTPIEGLILTIKKLLGADSREYACVAKIAMTLEQTGMSFEDSALLARVSAKELASWITTYPEIDLYFRFKRTQYKEKLLRILNTYVEQNKDPKIASYLLEKTFSEEYDPGVKREAEKKKAKNPNSDLEKIISFVRSKAPDSPVIEANTVGEDLVSKAGDSVLELSHLVSPQ